MLKPKRYPVKSICKSMMQDLSIVYDNYKAVANGIKDDFLCQLAGQDFQLAIVINPR